MSTNVCRSNVLFLMTPRPPRSTQLRTLFPYTTLFRSQTHVGAGVTLGSNVFNLAALLGLRSEEHTSELQSPSVISCAVFCLKKERRKLKTSNTLLYFITTKIFKK